MSAKNDKEKRDILVVGELEWHQYKWQIQVVTKNALYMLYQSKFMPDQYREGKKAHNLELSPKKHAKINGTQWNKNWKLTIVNFCKRRLVVVPSQEAPEAAGICKCVFNWPSMGTSHSFQAEHSSVMLVTPRGCIWNKNPKCPASNEATWLQNRNSRPSTKQTSMNKSQSDP